MVWGNSLPILLSAGVTGFYALTCLIFGLGVLRVVRIVPSRSADMSAAGYLGTGFAVGQALLGSVWMLLGAASLFSLTMIGGAMVVALLIGLPAISGAVPFVLRRARALAGDIRKLGWVWWAVVALAVILIASFFPMTWHRPGGDALAFYLAQPKLFAVTQSLRPLPSYETFSLLSVAAEMQFAVLFSLDGELAAKMLVWPTALCSAALLWAIGSEVGLGRRGQWALLALLFSTTGFTLVLWDGKTELFPTAWALAAVFMLLRLGKAPNWQVLGVSGVMAGIAMTAKVSFAPVLVPLMAVLVLFQMSVGGAQAQSTGALNIEGRAGRSFGPWLKAVMIIAVGLGFWGLVGISPMVIKNAYLFAEPLAPFYYFGDTTPFPLDQFWYNEENTRWIVATYPLALVFGTYPMQHGNLTPLWLAFLPLLFLAPRPWFSRGWLARPHPLVALSVGSAVAVVVWVALRPSILAPRYILPVLLTSLPLAAYAIEMIWQRKSMFWLRWGAVLTLLAVVGLALLRLQPGLERARIYAGVSVTPWGDPMWSAADIANNNAPPGTRILLGMYYRSFFRGDLLQCVLSAKETAKVQSAAQIAPEKLWAQLYDLGGRYLVIDGTTHGGLFASPPDVSKTPKWLKVVHTEFKERLLSVYALEPTEGAPEPSVSCESENGDVWQVPDGNS